MSPSPLAKKLGIKPGMRLLIDAPPPGYLELLHPLPAGASLDAEEGDHLPFVQTFVENQQSFDQKVPLLLNRAGENALLWITYPKISSRRGSDLSRDRLRALMSGFGWRAVTIVSLDEVWAALRFRPAKS